MILEAPFMQHQVADCGSLGGTAPGSPRPGRRRSMLTPVPGPCADCPLAPAPRYASRKCFVKNCSSHVRLLDVEGDSVRHVIGGRQLPAAALNRADQGDGLPVQRGEFLRRRPCRRGACSVMSPRSSSAMMPSASEWARIRGTGTGIAVRSRATFYERQGVERHGAWMYCEHLGCRVPRQDTEVLPVRGRRR